MVERLMSSVNEANLHDTDTRFFLAWTRAKIINQTRLRAELEIIAGDDRRMFHLGDRKQLILSMFLDYHITGFADTHRF